jgi:hypothetical protein
MADTTLGEFDALGWVDQYLSGHANLNYDDLRPVLCFSLIWNLFEAVACRRMANRDSIRRAVDHADESGRLEKSRYLKYVEYFKERYLRSGTLEEMFDRLLMDHQNSQIVVRRVLDGETQDLNNIVYALLLIAHRIRNNLFHGNKGIESLHTQTELFRVVNRLLSDFIEDVDPRIARDEPFLRRER